jgi:hypothetical protein
VPPHRGAGQCNGDTWWTRRIEQNVTKGFATRLLGRCAHSVWYASKSRTRTAFVRGVTARCVDITLFYFSEGMSAPVLLFQLARRGVRIPMTRRCSSLSDRLFWLPHRGGTMQVMSLPECLGTVVVHRGDAVTCTRDSCPRDLNLDSWFSHHTSFVTCSSHNCAHCGFEAPVQWVTDGNSMSTTVRRRRGGRLLEPAFRRHV